MNVHDYEEVFFRVARTSIRSGTCSSPKARSTNSTTHPGKQFYGGKLGIDATHKLPSEDARPWPEEIVMSDEIRARVTARWAEYGLGASPDPTSADSGRAFLKASALRPRRFRLLLDSVEPLS